MLVDLHLHTTCSDGVWTRERLFDEIRSRRLAAFSISDHDTLDAYPIPEDLRGSAISGVEVDSHFAGHTVHILAYGVEDKDSPLLRVLHEQRVARVARMVLMVDRLKPLGVDVDLEDVRAQATGTSSLGRPHLARALVAKGYVSSVQAAFDRYIADEGDGYVSLERQNASKMVELIHRSGGVAIVAHPKRLCAPHHLAELCALGIDGIEVVHPTANREAERELRAFAKERSLLVTGGTDFHEPTERSIGVEFEAEAIEALREAISARGGSRGTTY